MSGLARLSLTATIAPLETWALATVGVIAQSRLILFRALGYRLDAALLGELPMSLGWCYILARSGWRVGVRKQLVWRGRRYSSASRWGSA